MPLFLSNTLSAFFCAKRCVHHEFLLVASQRLEYEREIDKVLKAVVDSRRDVDVDYQFANVHTLQATLTQGCACLSKCLLLRSATALSLAHARTL